MQHRGAGVGDDDRDARLARPTETRRLLDSGDSWGDGAEWPLLRT